MVEIILALMRNKSLWLCSNSYRLAVLMFLITPISAWVSGTKGWLG